MIRLHQAPTRLVALLALATLVACGPLPPRLPSSHPPLPGRSGDKPVTNAGRYSMDKDAYPDRAEVPFDVDQTPDAVPRNEPRSRSGNSPVYEVFGKTYRVLSDTDGFKERGGASWYGKKFHGHKTASGEIYDMFKMTGAHKSLPLPTYARVTRLDTGKSVIVRINDRGPFHSGRVIDLSYAAAARLDMLSSGSTQVEVVALDPMEAEAPLVAATGEGKPARTNAVMDAVPSPEEPRSWLQVGVYSDPINAVMMREDLKRKGRADAQIVVGEVNGLAIHRVVFGPFANVDAMQTAQAALEALGYATTPMR